MISVLIKDFLNSRFGILIFFIFLVAGQDIFAAQGKFDSNSKNCKFENFLKNLVKRNSKIEHVSKLNTFSVSLETDTRPDGEYWVFWHEQKELLLLPWPLTTKEGCRSGMWGRRNLDLKKDVVKTAAEVGSSTYLVDEAWASKIIFDAVVRGQTYQIKK